MEIIKTILLKKITEITEITVFLIYFSSIKPKYLSFYVTVIMFEECPGGFQ